MAIRKTSLADKTMQMRIHEYAVVGRAIPTEKHPEPEVYRISVFARDEVVAKSRFWYFMKKLKRVKKSNGEVLEIRRIREECKGPDGEMPVKNYGIWLRYDSRTGCHNMYKEYRDITKAGAVGQMYQEMAGRHRAASCSIQIIKVDVIPNDQCRRAHILQMHPEKLKFPHIARYPLVSKKLRSTFVSKRAQTFFR